MEALGELTSTGLRPVEGHRGSDGKQHAGCSHMLLCGGLGQPAAKDGARAPVHGSQKNRLQLTAGVVTTACCVTCMS